MLPFAAPLSAQGLGILNLLGSASDAALDKLGKPGAFFADEAIRIGLPGPLRNAGGLLRLADSAGLTNGLQRSMNDAAGAAAREAKPIFRAAISRMTLADVPRIVGANDGASRYLRQSAGGELQTRLRPLVLTALGSTGAFGLLDRLGKSSTGGLLSGLGINRDGLTDHVTGGALDGIFRYMGTEEARLRANPLGAGKALLGGAIRQ
ncbi:MAG: DUF4197 domain-containing protein [Sphingomonas sp.]|nr:DUF4197 domain-containing protein [Sphingomonas sp.]